MPILGLVREEPPAPGRPPPWEPNWRLWRWVLAASVLGYGAARTGSHAVQLVLVFALFVVGCRAAVELFPAGDGLRHHRQ
jgi:hypothetical protein